MQANLLARLSTTTLGPSTTQARTERINPTQLGPAATNVARPDRREPSTLEAPRTKSYTAVTFSGATPLAARITRSLYRPTAGASSFSMSISAPSRSGNASPMPLAPKIADAILINVQDFLLITPTDKFLV